MTDHLKKILILTILAGAAILFLVNSAAAGPAWSHGIVTSAPKDGRVRHLGVKNTDYSLMQEVRVLRRYQTKNGSDLEEEISFFDIQTGDNVEILRQGFRIYEIVVVE